MAARIADVGDLWSDMPDCRDSPCEQPSRNCAACRAKWKAQMNVHLVDGTYELFRHYFAMPAGRGHRRQWKSLPCGEC